MGCKTEIFSSHYRSRVRLSWETHYVGDLRLARLTNTCSHCLQGTSSDDTYKINSKATLRLPHYYRHLIWSKQIICQFLCKNPLIWPLHYLGSKLL